MRPNAGVQPRRHWKVGNAFKSSIARKIDPISLDAQRRRLQRNVGRVTRVGAHALSRKPSVVGGCIFETRLWQANTGEKATYERGLLCTSKRCAIKCMRAVVYFCHSLIDNFAGACFDAAFELLNEVRVEGFPAFEFANDSQWERTSIGSGWVTGKFFVRDVWVVLK